MGRYRRDRGPPLGQTATGLMTRLPGAMGRVQAPVSKVGAAPVSAAPPAGLAPAEPARVDGGAVVWAGVVAGAVLGSNALRTT